MKLGAGKFQVNDKQQETKKRAGGTPAAPGKRTPAQNARAFFNQQTLAYFSTSTLSVCFTGTSVARTAA